MKKVTIGRGRECDIRLSDDSDRVSRKHAVIAVSPNGKMQIYDLSSNGTFVNGVRVEKPDGYPVKKGDKVNFANLVDLDWSKYRNPYRKLWIGVIVTLVLALIAAIAVPLSIKYMEEKASERRAEEMRQEATIVNDTLPGIEVPVEQPNPVLEAERDVAGQIRASQPVGRKSGVRKDNADHTNMKDDKVKGNHESIREKSMSGGKIDNEELNDK